MAFQVCMGAMLKCSFGAAPSSLVVLPVNRFMVDTPCANIMDNKPMVNVLPFGTCSSMANPTVAAATAAAMGALTPMPCVPMIPGPWVPGSPTFQIANMPAVDSGCKLICAWGGEIQVTSPGQGSLQIP